MEGSSCTDIVSGKHEGQGCRRREGGCHDTDAEDPNHEDVRHDVEECRDAVDCCDGLSLLMEREDRGHKVARKEEGETDHEDRKRCCRASEGVSEENGDDDLEGEESPRRPRVQ